MLTKDGEFRVTRQGERGDGESYYNYFLTFTPKDIVQLACSGLKQLHGDCLEVKLLTAQIRAAFADSKVESST